MQKRALLLAHENKKAIVKNTAAKRFRKRTIALDIQVNEGREAKRVKIITSKGRSSKPAQRYEN